MIRYILHFPEHARPDQMREFLAYWKEAADAKEQRDVAVSYGVTIEKLPHQGVPAFVRRARARAR